MSIEIGSVWTGRAADEVTVTGVSGDYVSYGFNYSNGESDNAHYTLANFEKHHELLRGADMVNHPPHYKDASGIECIEVTSKMSFCGGNCFKYLYRAGKKGSTVEDLKKAAWYADKAWEQMEVVSREAMDGIWDVAAHRSGYIQTAMLYIREDAWAMVERQINHEIARLESE